MEEISILSIHVTFARKLVKSFSYFCHRLLVLFTNYYYGSIPVINELHLVSSGSKSYLISGGDSSYSWVFIHVLDLWRRRSCKLYYWVGSWWHAPVPSVKNTNTQLGYSLYWLLLELVNATQHGEVGRILQQSSITSNTCSNTISAIVSQVGVRLKLSLLCMLQILLLETLLK